MAGIRAPDEAGRSRGLPEFYHHGGRALAARDGSGGARKKELIGVTLVVLALAVTAFAPFGSAFVGLAGAKTGDVVPGVRLVKDGFSNLFIVTVDDGVVLNDCGDGSVFD
jgi:hypothetical protein